MKLFFAVTALISLSLSGCSAESNRHAADVSITVAQFTCALLHAETDDSTVAQICGVADVLLPDLHKLLTEERAAARRYAASHPGGPACSDGGTR